MAVCNFEGDDVRVKLMPLDLDLLRTPAYTRGLPAWPTPERGRAIAEEMTRLSSFYGTRFHYNAEDGLIALSA